MFRFKCSVILTSVLFIGKLSASAKKDVFSICRQSYFEAPEKRRSKFDQLHGFAPSLKFLLLS